MSRGYISVGSNINKQANINSSLRALQKQFGELSVSSIYETEPVGFTGENFYNLAVGFDSGLEAKAVAKLLKQIETDHGRTRQCKKFSARTLDLDLLVYDEQIIDDGRLQIPRDEILRYAFVLEPLAEIAPTLKHPVSGQTYADLWAAFDKTALKQIRL